MKATDLISSLVIGILMEAPVNEKFKPIQTMSL